MPSSDVRSRLQALRTLLENEETSTQEELREELERLDFEVNQSTVSRDLRRLGAVKMTDGKGRTTYRLSEEAPAAAFTENLFEFVSDIQHNGALVVITTSPGSASLIARHIDQMRSENILGTIAGDDTIFVAPASLKKIAALVAEIKDSF